MDVGEGHEQDAEASLIVQNFPASFSTGEGVIFSMFQQAFDLPFPRTPFPSIHSEVP